MENKQNPFSLYDFLGYFTPGAIFLYSCIAIYANINLSVDSESYISNVLSFDKAEIYIPFVLLSYTIGHFISYWSSLLIEKYSIWTLDYPSRYLLGRSFPAYFSENVKIRLFVALLLIPITLPEYILNKLFKFRQTYAKSLDLLLIDIVNAKLTDFMEHNSGLTNPPQSKLGSMPDMFRLVYHYCVENAQNHLPKMQNYVALYGFLRTITFIFVLLYWTLVIWYLIFNKIDVYVFMITLSLFSIISFSFYLAFVKFYRRFSLEVMMALTAVYDVKKQRTPLSDKIKAKKEEIITASAKRSTSQ